MTASISRPRVPALVPNPLPHILSSNYRESLSLSHSFFSYSLLLFPFLGSCNIIWLSLRVDSLFFGGFYQYSPSIASIFRRNNTRKNCSVLCVSPGSSSVFLSRLHWKRAVCFSAYIRYSLIALTSMQPSLTHYCNICTFESTVPFSASVFSQITICTRVSQIFKRLFSC
jgi:hypothetical protein